MARPEYVEAPCKSALNRVRGMPFAWSLNPYAGCRHACVYCFAIQYHRLAERGTAEDFSARVFVKVNPPEVLAGELARPSWRRAMVAVGTATDPYQPAEGRYRLTRRTLELLRDHVTPITLLTKSPLVQRDADVLADLARRAAVRVFFSISTVDLQLWRRLEPGTANPYYRLGALRRLRAAGVPAGVLMAPVLPGVTDSAAAIDAVASAARAHGAAFFGSSPLRPMPFVKEHYLGFVAREFPELLPRYRRAYPGVYAPRDYRAALDRRPPSGAPSRSRCPWKAPDQRNLAQ